MRTKAKPHLGRIKVGLIRQLSTSSPNSYEGFSSNNRTPVLGCQEPTKPKPTYPCPICKSSDWWWRPLSPLGGPGAWCCGICHPETNKEANKIDNTEHGASNDN